MISRLSIRNFKSIAETDVALGQISVLIGANGAGKSNFIEFFSLLRHLYEQSLQRYVAAQAGAEYVLHFGWAHSSFLEGRVEFDDKNAYQFRLLPDQKDNFYFEYEATAFNRDWGDAGWDLKSLANEGGRESRLREQGGTRYGYLRSHFQSFRVYHFHDTSLSARIKHAGPLHDNAELREDGGNLAAFLYYLQEKNAPAFQKIEMAVQAIAPYFERFVLRPDRLREEYIRLEWREKGSDMYFNAMHLSDGSLRYIALATLLLQPELPATLILDEPELGLHPLAISHLASLIRKASARSQLIISTQSVNLVDHFQPGEIMVVDRKPGQQSVFQSLGQRDLSEWLAHYSVSDLWMKNVIGGRP